ncbi:MAG: pyruvate ferredoxin oxidoreductase [SAR202 cluster bacterium]|jgi:pyruvate ferredoxin oxidoreductase alpha subunit|nr:pyruvate ferredoxin oxidoreductase [Chloroflexota bacterium]MDP6420808.1 pyruvate ferredoxin oxidoreductase [SAR202 cluster bacterium]HAL46283.1 pyruvate ferredoxin oxidoreductase [Dehalococcoidia bacterium]MDP6662458.1 pyruvate ferredoxin oxidoreductase [SAR202 cluster bacterium]MDP6799787.1 pyruvate ferredoxin oxidoreductase [SAR202 cluster bacterium]|tara:strand:- start:14033 stop:15256 length:1224 start_codon:yes stop_codon:yes gene_type:complete
MAVARRAQETSRRAKSTPQSLNGGLAVAEAMRQTNPDVVACYPITPSTVVVEKFSEFAANGAVDTEFVAVESEHSAMSACLAATAGGVRSQTVTSSQGLAFMWEVLYAVSGLRLPVVLHSANRALSAPINIHGDHSDTMGSRDCGWIQLYAENPQEAYDNALMAVRIAEHPDVLLPVIESQDGFTVTHSVERVDVLPDDAAHRFVGQYAPRSSLLNTKDPVTVGALVSPQYGFEVKLAGVEAMDRAGAVITAVGAEFEALTGRSANVLEPYMMEDAELAIVIIGSVAGTARVAVDSLRAEGVKAGLVKIRSYRPFPAAEMAEMLSGMRAVAVLDRAMSPGAASSPIHSDVCVALFSRSVSLPLVNYVYGIGGRDTYPNQIINVFKDLEQVADSGLPAPEIRYVGTSS